MSMFRSTLSKAPIISIKIATVRKPLKKPDLTLVVSAINVRLSAQIISSGSKRPESRLDLWKNGVRFNKPYKSKVY